VLLWVMPEHVPEATTAVLELPVTGAEFVRAVATVGAESGVGLPDARLLWVPQMCEVLVVESDSCVP
jgi:hypothetical protein